MNEIITKTLRLSGIGIQSFVLLLFNAKSTNKYANDDKENENNTIPNTFFLKPKFAHILKICPFSYDFI